MEEINTTAYIMTSMVLLKQPLALLWNRKYDLPVKVIRLNVDCAIRLDIHFDDKKINILNASSINTNAYCTYVRTLLLQYVTAYWF